MTACSQRGEVDGFAFHESAVADDHFAAVDLRERPVTGNAVEAFGDEHLGAARLGGGHHGLRQRMFGFALDRGGQREELGLIHPVGDNVGDLRFAFGEGAGLVHDNSVDTSNGLECHRVLEQHAATRAETGTHHDRSGRGESERIGTRDDHHRDREQHRVGHGSTDQHAPHEECGRAADEGHEYQPERGAISQTLARRFGVLRLLNELDDLSQGGIDPDLGGPHPQRSGGVQRGADDLVAGRFVDRQTLAGDHRLVEVALAVLDDAVDRDLRAGANQEQVSHLDVGGRNLDGSAVSHDERHRRREIQQRTDRLVGAAPSAHLEPVAQQHERRQDCGRLVEHLAAAGQGHDEGVDPPGTDGYCDQHHHVEGAGPQRTDRSVEEDPGRPEHHGQGQQQLKHVVAHPERRGNRKSEHVPSNR